MSFFWEGLQQAWHLIVTGDPTLRKLTWVTLKVAAVSTAVALAGGVPIGLVLGVGRFPGRRILLSVANLGFVLPPVLVGLVLALLFWPEAPLGRLHLLYTLKAVYVAQIVLALPIVIALTAAAAQAVPTGLLDQARAFGARPHRVWMLALREARIGVFTAAIAAIGSALAEVGAVVLVGGNIVGRDQTLASAALFSVNAGDYSEGLAIGIILLGLMALIVGALTIAQQRDQQAIRFRASS